MGKCLLAHSSPPLTPHTHKHTLAHTYTHPHTLMDVYQHTHTHPAWLDYLMMTIQAVLNLHELLKVILKGRMCVCGEGGRRERSMEGKKETGGERGE